MKASNVLSTSLFLALTASDAQLANAPQRLRRDGNVDMFGRRTPPGTRALDSSSSAMSMPPHEAESSQEWITYSLSSSTKLKYRVNVPSGTTVEECNGCSVSVEVVHDGEAWIGIGFSETGRMRGSEAVIGTPDDGLVQKYNLPGYYVSAMPSDKQTLSDASIEVVDGKTTMKFTKLLSEPGEIEILPTTENKMLYARGRGTNLGYHAERQPFGFTLM